LVKLGFKLSNELVVLDGANDELEKVIQIA